MVMMKKDAECFSCYCLTGSDMTLTGDFWADTYNYGACVLKYPVKPA